MYLYAFPIWLLSSRINNVIASLCGRHKTLATNSPNNIPYTNILEIFRHTEEVAILFEDAAHSLANQAGQWNR